MSGKLFLVVADTTNLVTDLREERIFLQRLVGARARPPISNLFERSFGSCLHYLFSERRTMLALNLAQIFALKRGMRRYDAVRGVGAPHIKELMSTFVVGVWLLLMF